MSRFAEVPLAPPNPILNLTALYNADNAARKLNLGVGAYRTDEGTPYYFAAVRKAEERILADPAANKEYLPISGLPKFRALVPTLLLGADSPALKEGRVLACQALSGTGALRILFEFIARFSRPPALYIPDPSWPNHDKIAADVGMGDLVRTYRYYDPGTCMLDFDGLAADLEAAPEGSVVVLHACAHNPTGVDPSPEQWAKIADICEARKLFPLFDCAYQGFATGSLPTDAASVRMFVDRGFELFAAQSFAKNMGLYGERIGAATIVAATPDAAKRVLSQLEIVVRPMYSNPPAHGARIVAEVLGAPELRAEWEDELRVVAERIHSVRVALHEELQVRHAGVALGDWAHQRRPCAPHTRAVQRIGTPGDWSHVVKHIGMFTYTGLNKMQVERMQSQFHIYMLASGRANMAGLSSRDVPYFAECIHKVVTGA